MKSDISDICHDNWESLAEKHGKKIKSKYTTNDIRQLRQWFLNLDNNQSGEVGFNELSDPLLSAGILKTKEDVELLIRNTDTDGSGEIGFDEFLTALSKNKICNKEQIKTLQNITNKHNGEGLSTEMKLSEERRKHLLTTVINDTKQRQVEVDKMYSIIEREEEKRKKESKENKKRTRNERKIRERDDNNVEEDEEEREQQQQENKNNSNEDEKGDDNNEYQNKNNHHLIVILINLFINIINNYINYISI